MASFQTGNRADDREIISVQDLDLCTMAYVEATRVGVDRDVVEILCASRSLSQWNFLDQVVTAFGRTRQSNNPA